MKRWKSKESLRTSSNLSIKMELKSVVTSKLNKTTSLGAHLANVAAAFPAAGVAEACPAIFSETDSVVSVDLNGEKINGQRAISCLY